MESIDKMQLYQHTAAYAREHGELEQYRSSHRTNIECKNAIEQAISRGFDGMHLNHDAPNGVLDTYGSERVQFVLAATVRTKVWDGRFSERNKAWAESLDLPDVSGSRDDRLYEYAVNSHPAVLDGFISLARKEIAEREKPSIKDVLQQTASPSVINPTKQKPMER